MRGAIRSLVLMGLAATVSSCSDSPGISNPTVAADSPANTVLLDSAIAVPVVTRDEPLAAPITVSRWIGLLGGTISIPEAGLTVVVPALATLQPTLITVTAVAGRQVAYEFSPHGKQFLLPLTVTQRLAGTSAMSGGILPSVLYAGYFADVADLNQVNATALISELLGTSINAGAGTVTFGVRHFSGYLIASGTTTEGEGTGVTTGTQ